VTGLGKALLVLLSVLVAVELIALLVVAVVLFLFGAASTIAFGVGMLAVAAVAGAWAVWFARRGRRRIAT
jgi:hypothetical protein